MGPSQCHGTGILASRGRLDTAAHSGGMPCDNGVLLPQVKGPHARGQAGNTLVPSPSGGSALDLALLAPRTVTQCVSLVEATRFGHFVPAVLGTNAFRFQIINLSSLLVSTWRHQKQGCAEAVVAVDPGGSAPLGWGGC